MGRIRSVKPEFWRSPSLTLLPRDVRLTFIGLWTEADDHGRGLADPRVIKGSLFPLDDDIDARFMSDVVETLADSHHIHLYEVDGVSYYEIVSWTRHQAKTFLRGQARFPGPLKGTAFCRSETAKCGRRTAKVAREQGGEGSREQGGEQGVTPDPNAPMKNALANTCYPLRDRTHTQTGDEVPVLTPQEWSRIAGAAKNILDLSGTPEEVPVRGKRLVREWDEKMLTPTSLATHWLRFAQDRREHDPEMGGFATE